MRTHLPRSRSLFRDGTVTPLTILSLSLLVGMVALVIDGGTLMEDRRHVQAAADAAALAGATDLFVHYPANRGTDPQGTAHASARAIAAANGFGNAGDEEDGDEQKGSSHSFVTVNISPQKYQGGPNAGKPLPPGYVEVVIQYNADRLFSGIFGSGDIPVCARAVARSQWGPIDKNVVALNKTAAGAVNVGGSTNVSINGGLLVNSNSGTAITVAPTASLTATSVTLNNGGGGLLGVVGSLLSGLPGSLGLGGGGGGGSSTSTNYSPPIPDPFRSLPTPNPTQLGLSVQSSTNLTIKGNQSLSPGVYSGGITIGQGANVTLQPGIYYIQGGGLNVSGNLSLAKVWGNTTGVMIYNDWQSQTDAVNLGGSVVLAPPNTGAYQGLTIFQKRGTATTAAPTLTIVGSGNTNITGTIYAVYSNVTLEGVGGNNNMAGQIVADTVSANPTAKMNVDPNGQPTANARSIGLVE